MNLSLIGQGPTNAQPVEVVIHQFKYTPAGN